MSVNYPYNSVYATFIEVILTALTNFLYTSFFYVSELFQ